MMGGVLGLDAQISPAVETCTAGFVHCVDGNEVDPVTGSPTGNTCHKACQNPSDPSSQDCCVVNNDCSTFTGKVCRDGSCDGTNRNTGSGAGACASANIPEGVIDSCRGDSACVLLGGESSAGVGAVGRVESSCHGDRSCNAINFNFRPVPGKVGNLLKSCHGDLSCEGLGAYLNDPSSGPVGDVIFSCHGYGSCVGVGVDGAVGNIFHSCHDNTACTLMAYGGIVGDLAYSCRGREACFHFQYCASGSSIPCPVPNLGVDFLNGSCNFPEACKEYAGEPDGGGLTCINSATTGSFSPDTISCFDTTSEAESTCDGSSDVCTSLCPGGEAYIPSNYWVPPLDKPGMTCENVRLKIPEHGEFTCLPIGEGICRDNGGAFGKWRFGIEEVETPPCEVTAECRIDTATNTFPVLIDPANNRYPVTGTTFTDSETGDVCKNAADEAIRGCNYAGTTHICISENIEDDPNRYSNERPFMFFYDEKSHQYLYQLVCDGIGQEGKLPELKMVNQEDLADAMYVDYPVDIVKFKKGATPNKEDVNELWRMYVDWNGFDDLETKRRGKLASFIGVAHPNLCKEYVSPTDKACWKEDCDDVETPDDYELNDCVF